MLAGHERESWSGRAHAPGGVDRARARALPRAHAALARARRAGARSPDLRRPDAVDGEVGRRLSALLRRGPRRPPHRRRRQRVRRLRARRHGLDARPLAGADGARRRPAHRRARRRDDDDADRGLDLGRRGAAPPLRPAVLAVRADRDGRQPLRPAHRAPDPAAPEGARLQLVLPRLGRRDGRDHRRERRDRREAGQRRPAGRPRGDHRRRRVQRPRGRAAGARARRHRVRADRAGAHEHRHRAAAAGLSGRTRAGLSRDRDAAHLRRDAHVLGRTRRLRPGLGPDAGHRHDRQVARGRRAGRRPTA